MTVPSSTSEILTARGIVTAALQDIGVLSGAQTASASDGALGLRTLNFMLKEWQADGANLWRVVDGTATVGVGVNSFTPNPRLIDVTSVNVLTAGFERQLGRWERGEYDDLPNKATPGLPTIYSPVDTLDGLALRLWPVPNISVSLTYTGARVIADVTSLDDNIDVDQTWTSTVVMNLAARLCSPFQVTSENVAVIQRAAQLYQQMRAFDRPASYFLRPEGVW